MTEEIWWYATRAAGLMTWATASASMVVGVSLWSKAVRARTGTWYPDLHRFLSIVSVAFLAVHLVALWASSVGDFGAREILVPGASGEPSDAIAWSIVAAYLLLTVGVASVLRDRIHPRIWPVVHLFSIAAVVAGSYHAIVDGSDVADPRTWVIAGLGSLFVLALVAVRLERRDPDEQGGRRFADNREILEEMRQRLAELPTATATPAPQIASAANASLPRRGPAPTDLPGIESPPPAPPRSPEPVTFASDPFSSLPPRSVSGELGDWAGASPADPFRVEAQDLFAPVRSDERTPGAALDPFRSFDPVEPTPTAIRAPAPDAALDEGPPPLPAAIDPVTGEPDEGAYRDWLKDWLAYAERYGDEAPEDPARL